MRRRIVALVQDYAGLHLREIARQLDTSVALVEYHLPALEDAGLVHVDRGDRYLRVFPSGPRHPKADRRDREWLGLLREATPMAVALYLMDRGRPARHTHIAVALDIGKSSLSFHLNKLRDAGLIAQDDEDRYMLADKARLMRLLVQHRPAPDVSSRFARLWLAFYGRGR
jgi:DNA-binding transcriptional ArsR family regulator